MRVLITENSRLYRQLLDSIFGQLGFQRDISDSVKTARSFVESESYDLICVNQHLEDGSGVDFVEYCNKHKNNGQTPVLFLTSNKEPDQKMASLRIKEVILKSSLQQISAQITRFVEHYLDPTFSEGRILIIEDNKSMASVILNLLKSTGYKTLLFSNGESAWETFQKEKAFGSNSDAFDLIITDITLEGKMSGKELIKNIRALDDARGFIPIIAMTADNTDKLRLSLYESGITDFLQKPFLTEELLIRIRNLITNKRLLDKVHDQRRELFALATTDKLTGCHNRHSLMEFSDKFISQAIRHEHPVSLVVIDLDHFKIVNDTHGHAVGDIVLEAIGKLLSNSFREGDLVARFGGEEFVVLMNFCDAEYAKTASEKLREKIEKLRPANLDITASIGLTSMEIGQKADFELLFSLADKGVYEAKDNGRNRVVYLPVMNTP